MITTESKPMIATTDCEADPDFPFCAQAPAHVHMKGGKPYVVLLGNGKLATRETPDIRGRIYWLIGPYPPVFTAVKIINACSAVVEQ